MWFVLSSYPISIWEYPINTGRTDNLLWVPLTSNADAFSLRECSGWTMGAVFVQTHVRALVYQLQTAKRLFDLLFSLYHLGPCRISKMLIGQNDHNMEQNQTEQKHCGYSVPWWPRFLATHNISKLGKSGNPALSEKGAHLPYKRLFSMCTRITPHQILVLKIQDQKHDLEQNDSLSSEASILREHNEEKEATAPERRFLKKRNTLIGINYWRKNSSTGGSGSSNKQNRTQDGWNPG